MQTTPVRRRIATAAFTIGGALMAVGAFSSTPALAGEEPFTYGPGYDSYLHEPHQGAESATFTKGTCPTDASVTGMTSWHFVLNGSDHDFVTLDVTFNLGGTEVELAGLTPKSDFTGFNPDTNFIASPTGKHAYVFTDTGGTLLDAAAHVAPDAPNDTGPKFPLSHVCTGTGGGTTGGDDDPTTTGGPTTGGDGNPTTTGGDGNPTTTGGLAPTSGSQDDGPTDAKVEGEVVLPDQLPRTGSGDQSLFLLGIGFLAVGAIALVAKREAFIRS